jgi:hypothetical protein
MCRARAIFGWQRINNVRRIDAAWAFLGVEYCLAMFANIGGIFDMDGPAIARPPGYSARPQIISRQ